MLCCTQGSQAEGTSGIPVTKNSPATQVSSDATPADAQSESADAAAPEGTASQKQSLPPVILALGADKRNAQKQSSSPAVSTLPRTQQQASSFATPAAGLKTSASTSPAIAPETTQSKPAIKKRQVKVQILRAWPMSQHTALQCALQLT